MSKEEEILMAYVAGLMDGDGSFSIIKEKRARGFIFSPCIQLSNVFKSMPELLHNLFPGCIKEKSLQNHAKKIQFVWNVRGFDSCKSFLNKVLPYLVLKKKRAMHLLEFIDKFSTSGERKVGKDGKFIIRDITDIGQSTFHLKMQSLNNDCLTCKLDVVKQASKTSDDSIFWSYFSGIMDTDGSFSVRRNKPYAGSINFKYSPLIQLSMATFETMNYLRKNIAFGNVCFPKAKTAQRGFVYKLQFYSLDNCSFILNKIIPFIKFKKQVCEILLDFCVNYSSTKNRKDGISKEQIDFRHDCYQKIVNSNKYGYNKPSLIDSETLKLGDEGQV